MHNKIFENLKGYSRSIKYKVDRKLNRRLTMALLVFFALICFIIINNSFYLTAKFMIFMNSFLSLFDSDNLDLAKVLISLIGTVGTFAGSIVLFFNLRVAQENALLSSERLYIETFAKAVEQLANASLNIRLAGIYTLDKLARNSRENHWTIIEILEGYSRFDYLSKSLTVIEIKELLKVYTDSSKLKKEIKFSLNKVSPDIEAAISIIGRRNIDYDPQRYRQPSCRQPGLRIDLRNINIPCAELEKVNLEGALISQSNLYGVEMWGADLSYADFKYSYLRDSELRKVKLNHAELVGADFEKSSLQSASLYGADMKRANFKSANLNNANLAKVRANEANFEDTKLNKTNFEKATLHGSIFDKCSSKNVVFINSDLKNAKFQGAGLESADFKRAELRYAKFQGAGLKNTNFKGADLKSADFKEADLENADFQGANLKHANFQGAYIRGANFLNAKHLSIDMIASTENWQEAKLPDKIKEGLSHRGQQNT